MSEHPVPVPLSRWMTDPPVGVVAGNNGAEINVQHFISRVDAWMTDLEQRSGIRWAVYHSDSCELLAVLQALWQLGRTACVTSYNSVDEVERLAASVDGFCGEFPAIVDVVQGPANTTNGERNWIVLDADLVALELFTSGSSGEPKSISKTISQLQREIATLETLWPSESGSMVLSTVSRQHFYGLMFALLWPFCCGRQFETRLCEYPEDIIHRAASYPRFTLISSPSHLTRFNPGLDWSSLAPRCLYVVSSAAPLARKDSLAVSDLLDSPVREIYGSTETGAIAWRCQQTEKNAKWSALPGVGLAPDSAGGLRVSSTYLGEIESLSLPDRVDFDTRGCFTLHGRMDRIAKIEGKRVSMVSMEGLLQQHDWVDAVSALAITRTRIETAIVMQLSDAGKVQLRGTGRKAIIAVFKDILAREFEAVVLPRRWRFVEQMPYNREGKLPLEQLQILFEKKTAKWPRIVNQELVEGNLTLSCQIPSELIYFAGHMEGRPILPGIVQVHWAEHYGRKMLPVSGRFDRLEVVKFNQVVLPMYELTLSISFNEANRKLSFRYESERGVHSSGRICFRP